MRVWVRWGLGEGVGEVGTVGECVGEVGTGSVYV